MKNFIDFDDKLGTIGIGRKFAYYYNLFGDKPLDDSLIILDGFKDLIDLVYRVNDQTYTVTDTIKLLDSKITMPPNNKIVVTFSGGLDSIYQALKQRHLGNDVFLWHGINMNGAYPGELISTKKFSEFFGFPLETFLYKKPVPKVRIENPIKNLQLLANATDFGTFIGASKYAGGNDIHDTVDNYFSKKVAQEFALSDVEPWLYFENGMKEYITNYELIGLSETKGERIGWLYKNYPEAIPQINSCFSPSRFTKMLHEKNNSKYSLSLLEGCCGSCYKCCHEYIWLSNLGYYPKSQSYLNHCCDVIRKFRAIKEKPGWTGKDSNEKIIREVLTEL